MRHLSHPVRLALAVAASASLAVGLVGCGKSGDNETMPPLVGVPVGNLICVGTIVAPNTASVVQGGTLTITFNLIDVNLAVPGANIPVDFSVVGGALDNPPATTDANGSITVVFVAAPAYTGDGHVTLIVPTAQLDCEVSFTVFEAPLVVTARTTTGAGVPVTPSNACGSTEQNVQFTDTRRVVFRVTQVDPVTNVPAAREGVLVHVVASSDLQLVEGDYGPTNANGEVTVQLPAFPRLLEIISVTGVAVRPDEDADGTPDSLIGNSCTVSFEVETSCDDDGLAITNVVYHAADNSVKAAPMRPGESAVVTAVVEIDGVPQQSYPLSVSVEAGGLVNGFPGPVQVLTDGSGAASVTITAVPGTADPSLVVTFASDAGDLLCTQTATLSAVTCDWTLLVSPSPVHSGDSVTVTARLLNADPATAVGQFVTLNTTGGVFTPQPPSYQLVNSGGNIQVVATLNVTNGFTGTALVSMSFPNGYPCTTVTKTLTVLP